MYLRFQEANILPDSQPSTATVRGAQNKSLPFLNAGSSSSDSLERLVGVGDGPDGWATICRLVAALERSGLTALTPKPIQLGEPGLPDSWVIG